MYQCCVNTRLLVINMSLHIELTISIVFTMYIHSYRRHRCTPSYKSRNPSMAQYLTFTFEQSKSYSLEFIVCTFHREELLWTR